VDLVTNFTTIMFTNSSNDIWPEESLSAVSNKLSSSVALFGARPASACEREHIAPISRWQAKRMSPTENQVAQLVDLMATAHNNK
jgi:hypothetical protein